MYFLAIETTSRRLASTISFLAWAAFSSPWRMTWTMRFSSSILASASCSTRLIFRSA